MLGKMRTKFNNSTNEKKKFIKNSWKFILISSQCCPLFAVLFVANQRVEWSRVEGDTEQKAYMFMPKGGDSLDGLIVDLVPWS